MKKKDRSPLIVEVNSILINKVYLLFIYNFIFHDKKCSRGVIVE